MTSSITSSLVTLTIYFTTNERQKYVKIRVSIQTSVVGNSNSLFKMAKSLIKNLKGSFVVLFFNC